ncbi:hypothetical protein IMY05_001G0046500 [Salix suchowensis]|nr:hypothetical protein IMY05_001G0046500 [Salix suchowensis]
MPWKYLLCARQRCTLSYVGIPSSEYSKAFVATNCLVNMQFTCKRQNSREPKKINKAKVGDGVCSLCVLSLRFIKVKNTNTRSARVLSLDLLPHFLQALKRFRSEDLKGF